MDLTLLAKDAESGKTGCPSVYSAADGSLVIQGTVLDVATEANLLNLLPGEGAVSINAEVVREALARLA